MAITGWQASSKFTKIRAQSGTHQFVDSHKRKFAQIVVGHTERCAVNFQYLHCFFVEGDLQHHFVTVIEQVLGEPNPLFKNMSFQHFVPSKAINLPGPGAVNIGPQTEHDAPFLKGIFDPLFKRDADV